MVKFLDDKEGVEQTDFLRVIWEKTLDAALGKLEEIVFLITSYIVVYYCFNSNFNQRKTASSKGTTTYYYTHREVSL